MGGVYCVILWLWAVKFVLVVIVDMWTILDKIDKISQL